MSYVKPQVLVFQEYSLAPAEITDPLRAHISGPNAQLHRYDEADEKDEINVGLYDKDNDTAYPWPGRSAGSLVDVDSVRLFIENALLMYFEDTIGDTSGGRGVNTPVSGYRNRIYNDTVSWAANGTNYPRSGLLNDRDVQVGDVVYIRGVDDADNCTEHELWTYVDGLAADAGTAEVSSASYDVNNQGSVAASISISQTDGPTNCVTATADGSAYDGLADGYIGETYTIEVIQSSIAGCSNAMLRVTSASGTDNVDEVTPAAFGSPTAIGTRGLTVTFATDVGNCSVSASAAGVASEELIAGQTWVVSVTQDFERACMTAGSTYDGSFDDTYIIEVTKGGTWADLPEVTVTTTKGLDSSGPTVVTGVGVDIPVGSWGLTAQFSDCGNLTAGSVVGSVGASLGIGDGALAGLRKGDKFYISVVSGTSGPIRTLILRDDLPDKLLTATDLDVRLFIPKTIEVTQDRLSNPPNSNYLIEDTQMVVRAGITAYDETWTASGVEQPLTVWDGVSSSVTRSLDFGTLYIEYREWLPDLVDTVQFISDVADIDSIPGPLDEANPLKWGVYRALENSAGTQVGYTAVSDPDDLDAWQTVLDRIKGRDDVYNLVPLTYDREVHNLYHAHVSAESSAEAGNWKAMIINLKEDSSVMVVGESDPDSQALRPTSTDGGPVLAVLEDNPQATGTQYTRLSVPAGNSGFLTYGVKPGDVVRYLFSVDAFGNSTYQEFVVDTVLSENSLLLLNGYTEPVTVPQLVEIYHTRTKDELVEAVVDQAQSFADRRVVAVWPDMVGTDGNTQDGIFLGAAIAGLASSVVPHQGLTNVEISGFDDLASRTRDYLTSSQMDTLAAGGVWIATEDRDGTPHTRHALTTDTTDLNSQEEMIRRNVDSISYLFLRRLRPFIGRANVTPSLLERLGFEVRQTIRYLQSNGYTEELGAQLISGAIAVDDTGAEILRVHPLAADRVEIALDLEIPAPVNNIELRLIV